MSTPNLFTNSAPTQSFTAVNSGMDGAQQTEGETLFQQASQSRQPEVLVKRQFEQRNQNQKSKLANEFIASAGREGISQLAATPDGQHALAVVYDHAGSDGRGMMRQAHEEQGYTAVDYTDRGQSSEPVDPGKANRLNLALAGKHGARGTYEPSYKSPFGGILNPVDSYGNQLSDAKARENYITEEMVENERFQEKAKTGEITYKEASEKYNEARNQLKDSYRANYTSPEANEKIKAEEVRRKQNGGTTKPSFNQIYDKRFRELSSELGREPLSEEVYKHILEKGRSNPDFNANQAARLAKVNAVVSKAEVAAKPLAVVAAATDGYRLGTEINESLNTGKWGNTGKEASRIAGGWTGAWAGAKTGAAIGAYTGSGIGSLFGGVGAAPGAAIGGFFGGLVGSIVGYWSGSEAGENVYGWAN